MKQILRSALLIASSFAVLAAVIAGLLIILLHSSVFQERVRRQIVSTLEKETGGSVALTHFALDLPTWTIHLNGLTVHGSEPADAPPLLSIPSIDVTLNPLALLQRRLKISRLRIDQPFAYGLVHSDGSTTLPKLPVLTENPLPVAIDDLEIRSGTFQVNDHRHSFNLEASQFGSLLSYSAKQAVWHLQFSSRQVHLALDCCGDFAGDFSSEAILHKDSAEITNLVLVSSDLHFAAQGTLAHFAQPELALHFQSSLSAATALRWLKVTAPQSGNITLFGNATYSVKRGVFLTGHAAAQGLSNRTQAASEFTFAQDRLNLQNLSLTSPRGHFAGQAILTSGRYLAVQGRLENVPLQRALIAFQAPRIPWNAILSGPVSLNADLASLLATIAFHTNLHLVPVRDSPAFSGDLLLSKRPAGVVEFGDSHLHLVNTSLTFAGSWRGGIQLELASTDLRDVEPLIRTVPPAQVPQILPGGVGNFKGSLAGSPANPTFAGDLTLARFRFGGQVWDKLHIKGAIDSRSVDLASLSLTNRSGYATARGRAELDKWYLTENSPLSLHANLRQFALPVGRLSATLDASGTLRSPAGRGHLLLEDSLIYGRSFHRIAADAVLAPDALHLEHGTLSGLDGGSGFFSATYQRESSWQNGRLSLALDTTSLPASALDSRLNGQLDGHAEAVFAVKDSAVRPLGANGHLLFRHLAAMGTNLGDVTSTFVTRGDRLNLSLSGDLAQSKLAGSAEVDLVPGSPVRGHFTVEHASLEMLTPIVQQLPSGKLSGTVDFDGSLDHLSRMNASAALSELTLHEPALPSSLEELRGTTDSPSREIAHDAPNRLCARPKSAEVPLSSGGAASRPVLAFDLHNSGPILLHLVKGRLNAERFELIGPNSHLKIAGSVSDSQPWNADLNLDGLLNLQVLRVVNPNLDVSGQTIFRASLKGPLRTPAIQGRMELQSAALATADLPSGISAVNGVITFDNNRATVEQLTGNAGGGLVRLGGFVSFGPTAAIAYHLDAHAENVRVRSASNVSLTATTDLHLSGTAASSLLSGSATISRVVFNPSTDVGNILTNFAVPLPVPANRRDFLSNLHLDIAVESTPNFQLSTALSRDVEAEIDLRLRGTPDRPLLLGSLSANQGDIRVFGSRYTINRGEVRFSNTSKIDPVLDLDLQTQARGITVDITIAGTLNHLNITYRSDPPLQPRDIIALLTVGRTPQEASNTQNTQIVNDTTAFHSGTNSVLGQAVAPSTNRLSKLFGITNIKIDPLVQGITNTPQARLTLEQQVSRAITVTYVTNLSQTSEQIFRLEWSLNRQYSIVAVRDDNGEFGIDIQFKRRFK